MTTWIIAVSSSEIGDIIATADANAKLLVCGSSEFADEFTQAAVAEIFHLDLGDTPTEMYAPQIADFLAQDGADTILAANFAAERAIATAAAAKTNASWIPGAVSWDSASRKAVRNIAAMSLQTVAIAGAAALTLPSGGAVIGGNPTFTTLSLEPLTSAEVLSITPITANSADLSKAARVIGVGRGLAEESDLTMIRELATKIDAQIGGTRPLAEGYGWFDSYIGLTGQPVKAELYLAIGTSGQIHHAGGVRESNIIAAICDDPQAPIFQESDYGIVGDLYEIVPC